MNHNDNIVAEFTALAGFKPLSWQIRLFDRLGKGDLPATIALPTGLGKTMVMAIWLIARAAKFDVPTRLIYVVDRRTVVDQATDLAKKLRDNCKTALGIDPPAISTLRGQLADNREWSRDPSRPAIIIGTVDLIGSALLFSGYRSSYRRRPLEAGLLGQDALLVLDEAHLSPPFEKLLGAIQSFQSRGGDGADGGGKPLRVIRMSATTGDGKKGEPFKLEKSDLVDGEIDRRFTAKKTLTIKLLDKGKLAETLAAEAINLAEDNSLRGDRIVVFVRRPDDARAVAEAIRKHDAATKNSGPHADCVEVLTGTMRGLERDELVEKAVLKRFLDGDENPVDDNKPPVFLVSTSAGEVGFDLNADHMVCDAAPIDSLIQRLGRVNRRGKAEAKVVLVREPVKVKDGKPVELQGIELAIANTLKLLDGVTDISPQNLELKRAEWKDEYDGACSPEPATVELTDILLDNWSMTTINEPMPGRPEGVAPWLRGIDTEQAQTTVAWRAEIDLFRDHPEPEKALRAVFVKHPIRPHESLTVNTGHLLEFLKKIPKLRDRPDDLIATQVAVRLPGGQVVCRTLKQLMEDPGVLYADSTLILPARFGGLDAAGLLDVESIPKARTGDDPEPPSLDIADREGYEAQENAAPRLRVVIRRNESGQWTAEPLPGGAAIPDTLQLEPEYDRSAQLIDALTSGGLRLRLVQPIEFDEEDDPFRSLVMLAPVADKERPEDQSLDAHVVAVEKEARRIAVALNLAEDDPIRIALLFAAKWHDEGKKADIWQKYAGGPIADGPDQGKPKGKSRKFRDPKSLRGYRHEFGSLLRIQHPARCDTIGCVPPHDPMTRDLALHLIAAHHGGGRPHFAPAIYDPFSDAERDELLTDSIRRFARLQRKYGWWRLAWLESLLRCADALASADADAAADAGGEEGAEQ